MSFLRLNFSRREPARLLDLGPIGLPVAHPDALVGASARHRGAADGHALGVSNIFVVDDNFIGNKRDAKALLAALGSGRKCTLW